MGDIFQTFAPLGITIPEILLPKAGIDLGKWAVIACDQFTQDRHYWDNVKNIVGPAPSTLNLILPEVFLSDRDRLERIRDIHRTMGQYLAAGIFAGSRQGFIYLERDTPGNRRRRGLVAAIDLERYDWTPAARPLIRSTEGTVPERLPPRMDIRRGAPLETPHILLLVDDDTDSLLPLLGDRARKAPPVYETALMPDSGAVRGWLLDREADWAFIAARLEELARRALDRYSRGTRVSTEDGDKTAAESPFLFAVGDGNHSLAAAKGIWEEYKKNHASGKALPEHPCRYALVEIENIYDPAIRFEPIHRAVFGMTFDDALTLLAALPDFSSRPAADAAELARLTAEPAAGNRFGLVSGNRYALIETSAAGLATVSLQPLLDRRLEQAAPDGGAALSIDYIHGEAALFRLASSPAVPPVTGILLPPARKAGLFETVARSGPLPRKSFSMGEASEKRFYLECRKLF